MNCRSRSLSFYAVPLSLLWQPRIVSQVPYGFCILRNWIHFTRFVLWISKFDFMLFLYHNNPGRSFAQGISSTWFNSAQFLCSKVQMFFCSPTHQKHTYFPQPQLRRFRSLSNLSIPTFHQFQPVVISIILACFFLHTILRCTIVAHFTDKISVYFTHFLAKIPNSSRNFLFHLLPVPIFQ